MTAAVVRVLFGPWGCIALATGTVIVGCGVFAAMSLTDAIRDRCEAREWAAELASRVREAESFEVHVREALAAASEIVPAMVPADGKPLTRAERRALRGIEAASNDEEARQS